MTFARSSLTRPEASREIPPMRRLAGAGQRNCRTDVSFVSPRFRGIPASVAFLRPALVAIVLTMLMASPALADFRLCNNTGGRVGIALGYKDGEGWITEGW